MPSLDDVLDVKDPGKDAVPVVPHDTNDIDLCRYLIVSVGGTLKVITQTGETRALTVPAGVIPIMVTRVFSTDTAATGITAVY